MSSRTRRDVSLLMSAAGVVTAIISTLERERTRRGLPPEVIHWLSRDTATYPGVDKEVERIMEILEGFYYGTATALNVSDKVKCHPSLEHEAESTYVEMSSAMKERGDNWHQLQLHRVHLAEETSLAGHALTTRINPRDRMATQFHAEALLAGEQKAVPEEWRPFTLLFLGSAWKDPNNVLFFPYAMFSVDKWTLHYAPVLHSNWSDTTRIVREVI